MKLCSVGITRPFLFGVGGGGGEVGSWVEEGRGGGIRGRIAAYRLQGFADRAFSNIYHALDDRRLGCVS